MNELTQQGASAARAGNSVWARQLLIAATQSDEDDVAAWWWLAQVIGDPKDRHKCLQKAQAVAAESEPGRAIYKELLRESGAPSLPRFKLGAKSKSVGDQCPICTVRMTTGEEVVICPSCNRANHRECWEENVFHCGNFACAGAALVDDTGPVRTERAAASQLIKLDPSEIPDETPWASRETQEEGFLSRLRQRATEAMEGRRLQEMFVAGALQAQVEMFRQGMEQRARAGCLAGLLPGIPLAFVSFRYSQSWVMALFTTYLTSSCVSAGAANSFMDIRPVVSVLYWILPQVLAALLAWLAFDFWGSGIAAAAVGCVTVFLVRRILMIDALHDRRSFVAFGAWLLLGVMLIAYTRVG